MVFGRFSSGLPVVLVPCGPLGTSVIARMSIGKTRMRRIALDLRARVKERRDPWSGNRVRTRQTVLTPVVRWRTSGRVGPRERSGDRGAPRASVLGSPRGEAPRSDFGVLRSFPMLLLRQFLFVPLLVVLASSASAQTATP